jgi:hypothetical protein
VAGLLLVAGCEQLPATGDPLKPLPPKTTTSDGRTTTPSTGAVTPSVGADGYDFDEDAGDIETTEELSPTELLAKAQGKEAPNEPVSPELLQAPNPDAPVPAPAQAAMGSMGALGAGPRMPRMRAMQPWDPATSLPAEWGVSLVSTLIDTQPPRAVLGLPDGTEVVVTPGSFLPDQRMVVMAIGRNAVQVSRIVPQGFSARVETQNLTSLYPSQPVER